MSRALTPPRTFKNSAIAAAFFAAFSVASQGQEREPYNPDATQNMLSTFQSLHSLIRSRQINSIYYDPSEDREVLAIAAKLPDLLEKKADPNFYPAPAGISFLTGEGLTAFSAAISLALLIEKPDLVKDFIDNGADVGSPAPDGWRPIDYAVNGLVLSQSLSPMPLPHPSFNPSPRSTIDAAAQITKILEDSGASLADADVGLRVLGIESVDGYTGLAQYIVGMDSMRDAGLISDNTYNNFLHGPSTLRDALRDTPELSASFFEAHEGVLIDYPDARPGGPEPYTVKSDDTLNRIARLFYKIMGQDSPEKAAETLSHLQHNSNPNEILESGAKILIPMPTDHQIGNTAYHQDKNPTLLEIADDLIKRRVFYKPNMTRQDAAAEIATINGLDAQAAMNGEYRPKRGEKITIPLANIDYKAFQPLPPPDSYDPSRKIYLVVTEVDDESQSNLYAPQNYHGKTTLRSAQNTAYGINPAVDFSQFFRLNEILMTYPSPWSSDALRMLMATRDTPLQDRVVFSHSMAVKMNEDSGDRLGRLRKPDSIAFESIRLTLDHMNTERPIIFTGAGNFYADGEGRYIQSSAIMHSPRSIIVGSAGFYPLAPNGTMAPIISYYSSYGADVCAPLPSFLREQTEGTSHATPLSAAMARQFLEWFGNILSFEEIMAAGMMTAERGSKEQAVLDYDNPQILQKNPREENLTAHPAIYHTNGGGLPHHERCGPGILNYQTWYRALKDMADLKQRHKTSSTDISVIAQTERHTEKNGVYTYHVTVPQDMTLGRLTFLVPQEEGVYSDITVKSPAGFETVLPRSPYDVISQYAYAYEDVKAGDVFEIRTRNPLGPAAGIFLRGQAPGNTIQALRDQLRADGILPAPLKTLHGNEVARETTVPELPAYAPMFF